MPELKTTTCNRDCADACRIVATVQDNRIVRIGGDKSHPITRGFLCHRTQNFLSRQYAPDRLSMPLWRRNKSETFQEISFSDAMDIAAEQMLRVRSEFGPAAIYHYRSGGNLGHLQLVVDRFWSRFGPVSTKGGDICTGAGDAAQLRDFGTLDANDISSLLEAKSIVLWGKNVHTASPHTLPWLKKAKAKGTPIVAVDPIFHQSAAFADCFIQPRPGGDASLALGIGRLIFEWNMVHPHASAFCNDLDGFRRLCFSKSLEEHAADADVRLIDVERLAQTLGVQKPCTVLVGWGMARRLNGSTIVRAIDALWTITGNIGVVGAGVSYYFNRKSFLAPAAFESTSARLLSEPRFATAIREAVEPPVRAIWITAGNPVAMLPDAEANAAALYETDFVVVADSFLTDTAQQANLVLPTKTLLEDDNLLGAYGHHYIGVSHPIVSAASEVRSDLEIVQALASRVGLGVEFAGTPEEWKSKLLHPEINELAHDLQDIQRGALRNPLAPKIAHESRVFETENGKANLLTEAEATVVSVPTEESEEFPLFLMSCATPRSQSSQWVQLPEGPLECAIHPRAACGLQNGDEAWLESCVSALRVRIRLDEKQRTDVALVPKGGHLQRGQAANALVRPRVTDNGDGAALYDERVRLRPI